MHLENLAKNLAILFMRVRSFMTRAMSSANPWLEPSFESTLGDLETMMVSKFSRKYHSIRFIGSVKRYGERGHPCLIPLLTFICSLWFVLKVVFTFIWWSRFLMVFTNQIGAFNVMSNCRRKSWRSESKALLKSMKIMKRGVLEALAE